MKPNTASASCRWAATSKCSARKTTPRGSRKSSSERRRPRASPRRATARRTPLDIEAAEQALYDPRSYLAKSVPKRMAIISAGVIMNLVFAWVAATIAYGVGVKQLACEVGNLQPGDPAWQADMRVGDRILDINGQPVRRFRDLQSGVSLSGKSIFSFGSSKEQKEQADGVTMRVKRPGAAEDILVTMHPNREGLIPTIGIANPSTTELLTYKDIAACEPDSPAALAMPGFREGDKITKINGATIEDYRELYRQFAIERDKPLTVTVRRQGKASPAEELTMNVAPRPMRDLGLVMTMGPVTAVQAHSPAEKAGLQPGDQIMTIDGQSPGNPMTLPDRLRGQAGKTITLGVQREGKSINIPITVRPTETFETLSPLRENGPVGVPALGIAYAIVNKVDAVLPDGPAAKAGVRPGDAILAATIIPPIQETESVDPQKADAKKNGEELDEAEVKLGETHRDWPLLFQSIQAMPAGTRVRLRLEGDREVTLDMVAAAGWFNPDRGFRLEPLSHACRAGSLGEAMKLGATETWESATAVLVFLDRLISGQISPKALGGPVMIAKAAGQSAKKGMSEFLLFLTLLSANLAVINFLPIPVLDGGHIVFLTWEGIRGKPADERIQLVLSYLGLLFILTLMIWVISLDLGVISRQ